jgi:hypothetical protein
MRVGLGFGLGPLRVYVPLARTRRRRGSQGSTTALLLFSLLAAFAYRYWYVVLPTAAAYSTLWYILRKPAPTAPARLRAADAAFREGHALWLARQEREKADLTRATLLP